MPGVIRVALLRSPGQYFTEVAMIRLTMEIISMDWPITDFENCWPLLQYVPNSSRGVCGGEAQSTAAIHYIYETVTLRMTLIFFHTETFSQTGKYLLREKNKRWHWNCFLCFSKVLKSHWNLLQNWQCYSFLFFPGFSALFWIFSDFQCHSFIEIRVRWCVIRMRNRWNTKLGNWFHSL